MGVPRVVSLVGMSSLLLDVCPCSWLSEEKNWSKPHRKHH